MSKTEFDTIKLSELVGYLPYGLNALDIYGEKLEITGVELQHAPAVFFSSNNRHNQRWIKDIKPLLRPLSDLTKEIEHNGQRFVPIDHIDDHHNFSRLNTDNIISDPKRYPYTVVEYLLSLHLDIHGLIDRGLAIDLNTVKL